MGDSHGRDQTVTAELALAADGKFLALRWKGLHNVGAYIEGAGVVPVLFALRLAPTVYDIPAVAVFNSCVFTNTRADRALSRRRAARGGLYHGAPGRQGGARDEASTAPRSAAATSSRPPPCPTRPRPAGPTTPAIMRRRIDKCQALADWQGYRGAAQGERGGAASRRGRGIVYYVDNTGIFNDRMEIRFDPTGIVHRPCRHAVARPGARDGLCADGLGMARRAVRQASASPRPTPTRSPSAAAPTARAA